MRGASRASLSAARDRLAATLADSTSAQASELGDQLFAVVGLLDREPSLRRTLSDSAIEGSARAQLADAVFGGRISAAALAQVTELATDRWSESADLPDAVEELAVLATCTAADIGGRLDEVEDELFRFGRIVGGDPGLRYALANLFVPAQARSSLVTDLLADKVTAPALRLISQAAAHPRGRSMDGTLSAYANLAAELRQCLVAEVHVAVRLSGAQRSRLAAVLRAAYGHDVHLNVVVDPQLIGGMTIRIGDELINGSVASRLAELRRDLAA
jgi:F-type H+-transporting ATPase subunit delta